MEVVSVRISVNFQYFIGEYVKISQKLKSDVRWRSCRVCSTN